MNHKNLSLLSEIDQEQNLSPSASSSEHQHSQFDMAPDHHLLIDNKAYKHSQSPDMFLDNPSSPPIITPKHLLSPSDMAPDQPSLIDIKAQKYKQSPDIVQNIPFSPPVMTSEHIISPSHMATDQHSLTDTKAQEHPLSTDTVHDPSSPSVITPKHVSSPPDMTPETIPNKKRKMKGDRSNWARTKLKRQREIGEAYISMDGKEHAQKKNG